MEIHGLVAFLASVVLDEARATALDLDTTASFLLDVFDIGTAMADNLSTEVETRDGLEVDGNLFLRPFTLILVSVFVCQRDTSPCASLPFHTHHARPVQALCGGNASRQQGWAIPAS